MLPAQLSLERDAVSECLRQMAAIAPEMNACSRSRSCTGERQREKKLPRRSGSGSCCQVEEEEEEGDDGDDGGVDVDVDVDDLVALLRSACLSSQKQKQQQQRCHCRLKERLESATARLRQVLNPPPGAATRGGESIGGMRDLFASPQVRFQYVARLFAGRALATFAALRELCQSVAEGHSAVWTRRRNATERGMMMGMIHERRRRVALLGGGCAPEALGLHHHYRLACGDGTAGTGNARSRSDDDAYAHSASGAAEGLEEAYREDLEFTVYDLAGPEWASAVHALSSVSVRCHPASVDLAHAEGISFGDHDLLVCSFVLVELLRGTRREPSPHRENLIDFLTKALTSSPDTPLLVFDVCHNQAASQITDALRVVAEQSGRGSDRIVSRRPPPFELPSEVLFELCAATGGDSVRVLRPVTSFKCHVWLIPAGLATELDEGATKLDVRSGETT